jgi:hypothetical protein
MNLESKYNTNYIKKRLFLILWILEVLGKELSKRSKLIIINISDK